jgi:hypothetical protein
MIPLLAKLGGYSRLASWLDQTFALISETTARHAPPNYLELPYDWRLDNRQNARHLATFLAPLSAVMRSYYWPLTYEIAGGKRLLLLGQLELTRSCGHLSISMASHLRMGLVSSSYLVSNFDPALGKGLRPLKSPR